MKLQLLVPQYSEDDSVIKNLFDSLAIQQGISFDDFEILVGNDGSDVKLSEELLTSYPFSIKYYEFEHKGQAGARQALFDLATAEYIMYCDADDMFLTNLALFTIFTYMYSGFDALICDFVEEIRDKKYGATKYIVHAKDEKFVHGKVYRRRHLVDNNIKWCENIEFHEDSTYNILAITTAKNRENCKNPLYIWRWNDNSICRSDKSYILKTYPNMLNSNDYLIQQLLDRGMHMEAQFYICSTIYNTYYALNKPIWIDPMNAQYRYKTEKCFKTYYLKYKEFFSIVDSQLRSQIIAGIKRRVIAEGTLLEKFTFDEWINHIEELE